MLGSDYGTDHEYADSRVRGTIVRYEGEPVQVDNIFRDDETGEPTAVLKVLKSGRGSTAPLAALDLEPFKLGYVNYALSASYISRMPMRRDYKQGMRYQNINSGYGYHQKDIPLKDYYDTLMGKFPSFASALRSVTEGKLESCAWGHHWAVDNEGSLLYKFGKQVGTVGGVTGPVLDDNHTHLQEQLEESIV